MNKTKHTTMYKLIREMSDAQGTAGMTMICLKAFIESIRQLKCKRNEFDDLYKELAQAARESQPNIIPLIHLLEYFELDMEREIKPEMDLETVKKITIKSLEARLSQFERHTGRVTENGLAYVGNRDVIIVHSPSAVVNDILVQARRKLNKTFKVIVLDLSSQRTRQSVQALREAGIEHIVTPAHNLSHQIEEADKMFVGAMTITKDRKIVAPVGTAGTVSLCRLHGVKVHLFANTLNYSHRSSLEQQIFQVEEETQIGTTDFSLTTHSHDLVSLNFIDHIITEIGEVSGEGRLIVPPMTASPTRDEVTAPENEGIDFNAFPGIATA